MECRPGCGACCIAPSISSSPIPGMPQGKPGGARCPQLDDQNLCKIFGLADRPQVCRRFSAGEDTCGESDDDAFKILSELEALTR